MAIQSIDKIRVESAADQLDSSNDKINKQFVVLEKTAKRLEDDWKSVAGSAAQTKMYDLFKHNETRSIILQNYINMLKQQIIPGYERVERTNTRLADKFK